MSWTHTKGKDNLIDTLRGFYIHPWLFKYVTSYWGVSFSLLNCCHLVPEQKWGNCLWTNNSKSIRAVQKSCSPFMCWTVQQRSKRSSQHPSSLVPSSDWHCALPAHAAQAPERQSCWGARPRAKREISSSLSISNRVGSETWWSGLLPCIQAGSTSTALHQKAKKLLGNVENPLEKEEGCFRKGLHWLGFYHHPLHQHSHCISLEERRA